MDDPDAPGGTFVHWIAFNFDSDRSELDQGLGEEGEKIAEGFHGVNGFGRQAYGGPCPPSGRAHTYRITVYALDRKLELEAGSTVTALASAMRGNVLGLGLLEGTYSIKQ
jgi:Raf kinase inhibitor-like YbhB/YbcL family protein